MSGYAQNFIRVITLKYRHLFEAWVSNITRAQIDGFSKQMYNKENKVLSK
ncbi:hypothetical protein [Intestinibacter sp.]